MPGVKHTLKPEWAWGPQTPQPPATIPFALVVPVIDTVDASTPYCTLGYNGSVAATADEQGVLMLDDQTLTSWSIQFGTALAGAETLTAAITVNGVDDATMPIVLAAGATGGVANGSLAIPAGAKVAIHVTLGGGLVSKGVRAFVLAFDGVPFFVVSTTAAASFVLAHSLYGGIIGATAGSGGDYTSTDTVLPGGVVHPLPGNVTVTGLAAHTRAATAADLTFDALLDDVSAGSVTVSTGTQDASATISGTWAAITGAGDVNAGRGWVESDGGDTVLVQLAVRYVPASPYGSYCVIGSPLSAGLNFGINGSNADYLNYPGSNSTGADNGSTVNQVRWPNLPGTFKYLVGLMKFSAFIDPVDVSVSVEVNDVDQITASAAAVNSNPAYMRNDVDTVHVVSGDLIQFHAHHAGPYNSLNSRWGAVVGFLAD